MRFKTKFLYKLLVILLISGCSEERTAVTTEEVLRPDERQQAKEAVLNFRKLQENHKTSYVARGAHAKAHACVEAQFKVLDNIGELYRYGLLSQPGKSYSAWIRFSNGHFDPSTSNDQKDDVRGMAIKVLEPPGTPLEIASNGIPTQDFLMTNTPIFFLNNINDYNKLVSGPSGFMGFVFDGPNPLNWHIKELMLVKKTVTQAPVSPISPQYFSLTAYKLGPHNIKFSTKPCMPYKSSLRYDENDPDFLRKHLAKDLEEGAACFNFMVQLQDASRNMPIEDPTVEWKETDSPFIPVARITIPSQTFTSEKQQQFCENLAFSPWHALKAHQPLGQFNRLRRHVYKASSDYRHTWNNTSVPPSLKKNH